MIIMKRKVFLHVTQVQHERKEMAPKAGHQLWGPLKDGCWAHLSTVTLTTLRFMLKRVLRPSYPPITQQMTEPVTEQQQRLHPSHPPTTIHLSSPLSHIFNVQIVILLFTQETCPINKRHERMETAQDSNNLHFLLKQNFQT